MISVLSVVTATHPSFPQPHGRQLFQQQPMLLAQLAGAKVGIKNFVLKYQGSVFWLQIAASKSRGTDTEIGSHCVNPPGSSGFHGILRSHICFFGFEGLKKKKKHSKASIYMGEFRKPWKSGSRRKDLRCMLLPQAKSCHRHTRCENKQKTWVRRRIWFLGLSITWNIQFSKKKITRHKKKQESMVLSREQNKSMQNVSEDAKVSDLLDKDF